MSTRLAWERTSHIWKLIAVVGAQVWLWANRSLAWTPDNPAPHQHGDPLQSLPVGAAMSLLWWAAAAATTYLILSGVVLLFADAHLAGRLACAAAALTTRTRAMVGPILGLGAVVSVPPIADLHLTPNEPLEHPEPTATLELLDPAPTAALQWIPSLGARSGPMIGEAPTGDHSPSEARHYWLVRPGDNFWAIARQTIDDIDPRPDLTAHWLALIELNRDRLPDPGNPDLIVPGMVLRLPGR